MLGTLLPDPSFSGRVLGFRVGAWAPLAEALPCLLCASLGRGGVAQGSLVYRVGTQGLCACLLPPPKLCASVSSSVSLTCDLLAGHGLAWGHRLLLGEGPDHCRQAGRSTFILRPHLFPLTQQEGAWSATTWGTGLISRDRDLITLQGAGWGAQVGLNPRRLP